MAGGLGDKNRTASKPPATATQRTRKAKIFDRSVMPRLYHTAAHAVGLTSALATALEALRAGAAQGETCLTSPRHRQQRATKLAELVFLVAGLEHAMGAGAYARTLTRRLGGAHR